MVDAGFRVACFDAPAHGSNPGRQTHLVNFSDSLFAIRDRLGEIDTVIAHSLGAMATVYAQHRRLSATRLVLVAPHLNVQQMFDTFSYMLGMRPALARRFHDKIGARMQTILDGQDPWECLNPRALLAERKCRGLLAHDRFDPEVPQSQFDEIIHYWEKSELLVTDGLGHNRILKDAGVVRAIVDYISG